jgi:4-oxalocrotonate tautomerase
MAARTLAIGNTTENAMPIVTIQITREETTPEQKAALIKGATDLLVNVLDKPPSLTFVIIEEVDMENWGLVGLPATEYWRRARSKSTT